MSNHNNKHGLWRARVITVLTQSEYITHTKKNMVCGVLLDRSLDRFYSTFISMILSMSQIKYALFADDTNIVYPHKDCLKCC